MREGKEGRGGKGWEYSKGRERTGEAARGEKGTEGRRGKIRE